MLLLLRYRVKARRFWDWVRYARRYYGKGRFMRADLALMWSYLGEGPYTVSRKYLEMNGLGFEYTYGETPLMTLAKICDEAGVKKDDRLLELGAGVGRTGVWMREVLGCQVRGVERVSTFVERANRVVKDLGGIEFLEGEFLEADFSWPTVIYLYGTCLEDVQVGDLVEKFEALEEGARVITVSYSLAEYAPERYRVERSFQGRYPWGMANIYVNTRLPKQS